MKRITRATAGTLVEVSSDRMGDLTVNLVRGSDLAYARSHTTDKRLVRFGALLQRADEQECLFAEIAPKAARQIKAGFTATCYIPAELALCLFAVAY